MPVTLVKSKWSSGSLIFYKQGSGATTSIDIGVDGTGLDVAFYGDTASAKMLWDQSGDALVFSGASKITMGTQTTLVLPVKASGSTVAGDIWLDTTDSKLHFYTGTAEGIVTHT